VTERSAGDYIQDSIDAMEAAGSFIEGMSYNDCIADRKTVYASLRAIRIIGEASKKIPESVREKQPGAPWREMARIFRIVNPHTSKISDRVDNRIRLRISAFTLLMVSFLPFLF